MNQAMEQHDRARGGLTATGWQPGQSMSFAEWVEHGRKLGVMGRSAGWWIGDWLIYGNWAYGERYARASRITGYDVQSLKNMAYVASHVEPSRRRAGLSWSHHVEVVTLDPPDQDRWLERAERERLSVRCLREEIRREARALRASKAPAEIAATSPGTAEPSDRAVVCCPSCGHSFQPEAEDELTAAA